MQSPLSGSLSSSTGPLAALVGATPPADSVSSAEVADSENSAYKTFHQASQAAVDKQNSSQPTDNTKQKEVSERNTPAHQPENSADQSDQPTGSTKAISDQTSDTEDPALIGLMQESSELPLSELELEDELAGDALPEIGLSMPTAPEEVTKPILGSPGWANHSANQIVEGQFPDLEITLRPDRLQLALQSQQGQQGMVQDPSLSAEQLKQLSQLSPEKLALLDMRQQSSGLSMGEFLSQLGDGQLSDQAEQGLSSRLFAGAQGGASGLTTAPVPGAFAGVIEAELAPHQQKVMHLHTSFNRPDWSQAFQGRVMWMMNQGLSGATIRIDPPELGPIRVDIHRSAEQTQVTFVVNNSTTREALESQSWRLKEQLASEGHQVDVDIRRDQQDSGGERQSRTQDPGASQLGLALEGESLDEANADSLLRAIEPMGWVDYYI